MLFVACYSRSGRRDTVFGPVHIADGRGGQHVLGAHIPAAVPLGRHRVPGRLRPVQVADAVERDHHAVGRHRLRHRHLRQRVRDMRRVTNGDRQSHHHRGHRGHRRRQLYYARANALTTKTGRAHSSGSRTVSVKTHRTIRNRTQHVNLSPRLHGDVAASRETARLPVVGRHKRVRPPVASGSRDRLVDFRCFDGRVTRDCPRIFHSRPCKRSLIVNPPCPFGVSYRYNCVSHPPERHHGYKLIRNRILLARLRFFPPLQIQRASIYFRFTITS